MKKITKIALIASLIFALAGFLLILLGIATGAEEAVTFFKEKIETAWEVIGDLSEDTPDITDGSFWEEITKQPTDAEFGVEQWDFSLEEGITRIEVDTEYSTVHIMTTDEEIYSIEVFGQKGSENDQITAVVEDGVLKITEVEKSVLNVEPMDNSYIQIKIPESYEVGVICIESDAGLISYDVKTVLEEFYCHIDAGALYAEYINCKDGEISVDAGNIKVNNSYMENLRLNCDVGNVELKETNVTKSIELECDTGRVEMELCGKKTDYGFAIENSVGTIKIDGEEIEGSNVYYNDYQTSKQKVNISCDIGTVKVSFTEE